MKVSLSAETDGFVYVQFSDVQISMLKGNYDSTAGLLADLLRLAVAQQNGVDMDQIAIDMRVSSSSRIPIWIPTGSTTTGVGIVRNPPQGGSGTVPLAVYEDKSNPEPEPQPMRRRMMMKATA
jgi:hypothetical protein